MAFGATATLLDDFNRTNETPLASPWSNAIVSGNGNINLNNSAAAGATTGVNSAWYSTTSFGPDVETYATIPIVPATGNVVRVYGRIASPGTANVDAYFVQVSKASGPDTWNIYRLDNGTATSIASGTQELSAGDKIGLECIGSSIKAYYWATGGSSWTQILAATDATYSAAGSVGIGISNQLARIDDLFAGTIAGGSNLTKNLADTITMSDSIAKAVTLSKADTITLSDSIAKAVTLSKADTITLSDAISKGLTKSFGDTITLGDAITVGLGKFVNLSDTITLSDAIAKGIGKVLNENFGVSDALADAFTKSLSDTITITDAIGVSKGGLQFADVIHLSDSIAIALNGAFIGGGSSARQITLVPFLMSAPTWTSRR